MADQKFTRCPGCATVFRVTPAQLALRDGQVRCGHCRAVFDANDHVVSLDAGPAADEFDPRDELAMGRPTVTLRSADALLPVPRASQEIAVRDAAADDDHEAPAEAPRDKPGTDEGAADESLADERSAEEAALDQGTADEGTTDEGTADEGAADEGTADEGTADEGTADKGTADKGTADKGTADKGTADKGTADKGAADGVTVEGVAADAGASAPAIAPIDLQEADRAGRFEWKKRRKPADRARRSLYAGAIVVLAIALALQGAIEFRDALAAHVPATRPLFAAACRALACAIEPLRDGAALSIDASDLQADPAHRGLLMLSATIRNRAAHAIAYPYLELTLTDSSDRIVVRRAFAPSDYAGGTQDPREGIPANGERLVKLFIDASATQQAGYQLYLFYP